MMAYLSNLNMGGSSAAAPIVTSDFNASSGNFAAIYRRSRGWVLLALLLRGWYGR